MSSRFHHCLKQNLLPTPPGFLKANLHYEVQMGSVAYGVSNDNSDMDIYGWAIPPKDMIFPHLRGEIEGFGTKGQRFEQYQQHHVWDGSSQTEYDFTIYSVVRYIHLCMENNPNMIDSLFVPARCILHITNLGHMLRDVRKDFLHKGAAKKLIAYAHSQLHKADIKKQNDSTMNDLRVFEVDHGMPREITWAEVQEYHNGSNTADDFYGLSLKEFATYHSLYSVMMSKSKRLEGVKRFGWDPKFLYHVIRLVGECEQILTEHDLVLDEEHRREQMKSVRRGDWKLEDIRVWYTEKERHLESALAASTLRQKPDEERIKQLLLNILEAHYGSLSAVVSRSGKEEVLLRKIAELVAPYQ